MNYRVISACIVLALMGAGCETKQPTKQVTETPTSTTATSPDSSDYPTLHSLFQRDAKPDWIAANFDHWSMSIPYSKDWKISEISIAPLESGTDGIDFGRPIDNGTYIMREYSFYRLEKNPLMTDLNSIQEYFKNNPASLDNFEPKILHIGSVDGVEFHDCGAKNCNDSFVIPRGKYNYYLTQRPNLGEEIAGMTDEMKKIIESIH